MKYFESVKIGSKIVLGKAKFRLVKHSPDILMGVGVVAIGVGTYMACKATLKVEDVLDMYEAEKQEVRETFEEGTKEYGRQMFLATARNSGELFKMYAPAALTSATGVACILTSHNIIKKRNVALAAAYSVLDKGFKEYRGRVVEDLGIDKDRQYRYGVVKEEIEVEEVTDKGKKKKVKKEVDIFEPSGGPSVYARVFEKYIDGDPETINHNWSSSVVHNKAFLRAQQNYANDLLKIRGHIFLNEVYDMLGFPRTDYGAVVGWVMDPNSGGDGYVDFGLFDVGRNDYATDFDNDTVGERRMDFINEVVNTVLLDFNVDGVIYNLI